MMPAAGSRPTRDSRNQIFAYVVLCNGAAETEPFKPLGPFKGGAAFNRVVIFIQPEKHKT